MKFSRTWTTNCFSGTHGNFFRSYKNFSGENFKQDLSSAPWRIGEVFKDLDDQLLFWNTVIKSIVDEHAPIKTMHVRGQDVLYMTAKWKNAIGAKRKAGTRYEQNKMAQNLEEKRKSRNEVEESHTNWGQITPLQSSNSPSSYISPPCVGFLQSLRHS